MIFQEFSDPRLVALYDLIDPVRADTPFYVRLAASLDVSSIIDVGCGTGAVTCELARHGYRVTGVDPASAMLDVARGRPGGHLVRWVEGDATAIDGPPADLAIMTAHVAQVISDEDAWRTTLAATRRALRPGGHLVFDSRNPAAEAWRTWTPDISRTRIDSPWGPVDLWFQSPEARGDLVRYEIHYRFVRSGDELVSANALRFRTEAALSQALSAEGFAVQEIFGDWDGNPLTRTSPEMIFVATRD